MFSHTQLVSLAVLVCFCLLSGVESQAFFTFKCPKGATAQKQFNLKQFQGRWYANSAYMNGYTLFNRCHRYNFAVTSPGVAVFDFNYTNFLGKPENIRAVFKRENPQSFDGNMVFAHLNTTGDASAGMMPMRVLETDYTTYAILWSCSDMFIFNSQHAWVLTRQKQPGDSVQQAVAAAFTNRGLDPNKLNPIDQSCEG